MASDHKTYKNAFDFRRALEARLLNISHDTGTPLDRLRRGVAFDRLLARVFATNQGDYPQWLLKGGYALEIRWQNIARTTKDIDFTMPYLRDPSPEKIQAMIQEEAGRDLHDWFVFRVGSYQMELDQPVYGGWRFPVEARVDNREFSKFHLDVGVGDALVSSPEWQTGGEVLSFANILPARAALLPRDQQFAEKLHSLTFPRDKRAFSRVKDIVDLVLLIEHGLPDKETMRKAIKATFEQRKTHELPAVIPEIPQGIAETYREMAEECGVSKKSLAEAEVVLEGYWKELFCPR